MQLAQADFPLSSFRNCKQAKDAQPPLLRAMERPANSCSLPMSGLLRRLGPLLTKTQPQRGLLWSWM